MDELESPELRNIEMADGRVRIGRPALADSPTLLGTISESTDFYESLAVWTLAPPSTQEQRSDVLLKDHVNSDHGHGYTVQVSGVHDDEQGKGEVADSEHLATSATQSTEPLNVNSGFMTMEPVVSALAKSPTSAEGEVRNRYAGTNTDVHEVRSSITNCRLRLIL